MKVSFIGLGRMGQVMARRLLDAHHDVLVYNRSRQKVLPLADRGARVAGTVGEASRDGGPVITMLSDDRALADVAEGPGGIIENLPRGGVHVVMGTHQVETVRALAAAHRAAGQMLVAAPVVGRPAVVEAGRLGIIIGGSRAAVAGVRPLFKAIGRRTFRAGTAPEAASLLKLCNNLVLACAIEAMGEAFSLVEKFGADKRSFQQVMVRGLFKCIAYDGYSRAIVERSWDTVNVTARLALKDVSLVLGVAEALEVPLPSAEVCRTRLLGADARGDSERDWTVMALEQGRAAGLDWDRK